MRADVIPLPKRRKDAEILSQVGKLLDQVQSDRVREELQRGWEKAVSRLICEKWASDAPECALNDELSSREEP